MPSSGPRLDEDLRLHTWRKAPRWCKASLAPDAPAGTVFDASRIAMSSACPVASGFIRFSEDLFGFYVGMKYGKGKAHPISNRKS